MVIAIILALAIAIVPNIGAGISGTQLATASRSLLQAARYARTMAILHQVETELVLVSAGEGARMGGERGKDGKIDPASARIEVRVAAEALRHAANLAGTGQNGEDPTAEDASRQTGATDLDDSGDGSEDAEGESQDRLAGDAAASGAALGDFADEIHSVFPCGTVVFEFVKFTDDDLQERDRSAVKGKERPTDTLQRRASVNGDEGLDDDPDGLADRTEVFLFDSDGICRPFEVLLKDSADADASQLSISIDRWGRGKIEGRDDDD